MRSIVADGCACVLVLSAVMLLPIAIPATPPTGHNPMLWLLGLLLVSVGLPFFVVSSTAPLLQRGFLGPITIRRRSVLSLARPAMREPRRSPGLSRPDGTGTPVVAQARVRLAPGYGILACTLIPPPLVPSSAARGMRPAGGNPPVPVTRAAGKNVAGAGEIDATLRWSAGSGGWRCRRRHRACCSVSRRSCRRTSRRSRCSGSCRWCSTC